MPNSIASPQSLGADSASRSAGSADAIAFCSIVGLVLYRLVLGLYDQTELSTDEAQYWYWGQTLEFGAYSKPPLIGWIIRLGTELLGQTVWAVRLPATVIHGLTAGAIYLFARRRFPAEVALLAAFSYLTLPAVALGSALMTTDTPMLLAAAVALLAQARAAEAGAMGRRAPVAAMALGLALGLGLLAKHAMLFWLAGSIAAAALSPAWRLRAGDAAISVAVLAAVVAPHVAWLVRHDFVTFQHVQQISKAEGLSILRPVRFVAEQFLVMGPILFAALLMAMRRMGGSLTVGLAALAMAPLLIIVAQGIKGPVLANWAVLYIVPGSLLAANWLARHRMLAGESILLGLIVSLALPVAKVFGTDLTQPDGRPVLARYLGHSETAHWALATARQTGARTLVARDRDLLADLSWFAAGTQFAVRALPPHGQPRNHWEMSAPFDPAADAAPVLLILREGSPLPCPSARQVDRLVAGPGFAQGETFTILRLDEEACLTGPEAQ